jgi:hypothetical protein
LLVCGSVVLPAEFGAGRKGWLVAAVGPLVVCGVAWLMRG